MYPVQPGPSYPVGPPPREPRRPEPQKPSHLLHLVLTLITFGFWLIVWVPLSVQVNQSNYRAETKFEEDYERWRHEYYAWQTGQPAPPQPPTKKPSPWWW